jgi:periplasmic divalent cation tolerance protein
MESYLIVITTCASSEEAEKIVKKVLNAHLIACANILLDVNSFFHWKGKVTNEKEVLVLMKTRKKLFPELLEWIQTHHSYEVPEIIALPIIDGSPEYLDWIKEETSLASWN